MPRPTADRPNALVWLRTDLRTHDHEPLVRAAAHAARHGGGVLPVWILDPRALAPSPFGFARIGPHRARFLVEALDDLRTRLRALGTDLWFRTGAPEAVLPALARAARAGVVFHHEETTPEETTVEAEVEHALAADAVALDGAWGHTLVHADDLPFALDALPDVFTRFRTALETRDRDFRPACAPRPMLPTPARLAPPVLDGVPDDLRPASGALPSLADLGVADVPDDPRTLLRFTGGETAGRARLERWVFDADRLGRYKTTRNGMLAPDDASRLSPWLAHGCLSPRLVLDAVRRYERARGRTDETYWLVFELLWRDYFRFVAAQHGARLFARGGLAGLAVPWRDPRRDAGAAEGLARWRAGTTGFPLVDAAMQELAATGYTSNRARQNVASFLTRNLGVDWRAGAEWFEATLVDHDPASNWGNWAYAAGVGNDARGFRFFNLHKQAAEYDPDGAYVRHWLPALRGVRGGAVHRPERLHPAEQARSGVRVGVDYPAPMVDLFESAAVQERAWERAARAHAVRRRAPGGVS